MSLTSFIKQEEVKRKLQEEFPKPRFNIKKQLLFPPITRNYTEVAIAFDYLFSFGLKRNNPEAIEKRWPAEFSLEHMPGFTFDLVTGKYFFDPNSWEISDYVRTHHPQLFRDYLQRVELADERVDRIKSLVAKVYRNSERADSIIPEAKTRYSRFLKSGRLTKNLIKSAIFLARLHGIARGNVAPEKPDLESVSEKDIADLRNLIKAVNWDEFKVRKICLLNPTFGKAGQLAMGAKADVVIDDTLIEIKTTKKWELKRDYFDQLIGYYCLYHIGGIAGFPKNRKIKRFGIYFSRYAYFHTFPIDEFIDQHHFAKFLRWFKDKLQNYAKTRKKEAGLQLVQE